MFSFYSYEFDSFMISCIRENIVCLSKAWSADSKGSTVMKSTNLLVWQEYGMAFF